MRKLALILLSFLLLTIQAVAQNYQATQGVGIFFGTKLVGSVNYPQWVVCDPTTPANCATILAPSTQAAATNQSIVVQENPGSPLYAAAIAPSPCKAAATWNASTGLTGTQPVACDGSAASWMDLGAVGGAAYALGQQLAAASMPVVLPATQITSLTPIALNDPCGPQNTKLGAPISLTASGQIITGTASVKTYICAIDVVPSAAQNVALVEGTGTTCATNIFGLAGGTTAATGWNFQLGGGIARGSGNGTVYSPSADANATAANVCLLIAGAGQVSGQISYVKQ